MSGTRGWGAFVVWLAVAIAAVALAAPAHADAGDPVGAFDTISIRLGGAIYLPDAPKFTRGVSVFGHEYHAAGLAV